MKDLRIYLPIAIGRTKASSASWQIDGLVGLFVKRSWFIAVRTLARCSLARQRVFAYLL